MGGRAWRRKGEKYDSQKSNEEKNDVSPLLNRKKKASHD